MSKVATADVVIFGGGIAGLWLLNRLHAAGYSALLFESGSLGGGQTHKAQGIIHGGMKYALQGVLTPEAFAMAGMPGHWRQCLEGQGEIDLSSVPILSQQQYLWSPNKFASKISGFLAGAALTSKVEPISRDKYPSVFQHNSFKGEVYSLDEMVIDVPALVRELTKTHQESVFKIEPLSEDALKFDANGNLLTATVYMSGKAVEISAQQFIFTAGTGNEMIIKKLKSKEVAMQRRPLHMVLVKTQLNYPLYAHCMGLGGRPRVTITTHYTQDGRTVWYLGGQLSEDGVKRDMNSQINAAREELNSLFPWVDFSAAEFSSFVVDRAEPKQKGGMKPNSSFTKALRNVVIAWPTKLALAPKLAHEIMQHLENISLAPTQFDNRELRSWPIPPLAKPVWEAAFCKSVA